MSERRTFAVKRAVVLGAAVLTLLAACMPVVLASESRPRITPAEEAGFSSPADVWGPGNPTIWTRYYDTPSDYQNYLNPHYIDSGGQVPRSSYVVEMFAILNVQCSSNGYPGCPETWLFSFRDPQGGSLYWVQARAFSAQGSRWTEWTDSQGFWQIRNDYIQWNVEIPLWVNCQLANGNYTANVAHWSGPNFIYSIPFPFSITGGQCGPPPVPMPIGPVECVPTVRPTLSWNPSTGAESYQVVVHDVQTGAKVIDQGNVPGTSYTVPANSPLQPNRRYSWNVRAFKQGGGYSAYSVPLVFTPLCQAPGPPQALSPSGCTDTTTPTLQWTAPAGATSYRVTLVDTQTNTERTQTATTTSWTIPEGMLVENRQYTWTVAAFNEHGGSPPSNSLSFIPRCGAPAAPVAQAPSGCITTLTPTLTWSASNGATHYDVYVTDTESDEQVLREPFHPQTSYTVPAGLLHDDRVYHWRVRAYSENVQEHSPWSNLLSFTPRCGPPREAPIVFVPKECTDTRRPTFSWSAVQRATKYQLYVANTQTGQVVINEQPTGTTYTPTTDVLQPNTQYHWHVKGINNQYDGPTSETLYFTPLCEEVEDEEEDRPDESCDAEGPPESVHNPVSVLTGNMYFDHVDLAVAGVGSITFGRSYNSSNVKENWPGIFGPGWSHPYETSIWIRYRLLVLRQPNGAVLFFQDEDNNGIFEPRARRADTSTIRREANGTYVRRFRYGGSQVFDAQGRLIRLVDLVGNETRLVRDPAGKLQTIQDAGGRTLTLRYAGERLTSVEGPAALVTVTYTYDTSNRLRTVTYGDGSGYLFEYDEAGPIKTVFDHTNRVLEAHTYDGEGRALTSTLADHRESHTFDYDVVQTTVTDGLGAVTRYDFSEIGGNKHVVRITGPCASCGGGGAELQEWSYDAAGRVATYRRGSQVVASYEYDPVTGDRLVERDGLSNATVYTYYPDGRVRTVTGPDGSRKAIAYVPAGPSRVADAIDATRTRLSTITYTPTGKVERVTDPRGKVTRFVYDAPGDLREIHGPENQIWRFTYDAMGRQQTATSPLNATVTTAYDERGRTKKVTHPDGTFVDYTYDDGGRLTQMSDSLGRKTRHGYDAYGRIEFSVDPAGGVTRRSYDLMSRLTGLTDARLNTTTFEYDALGRPARTVHPDGAVEALTYDELGRVETRTDRRGVVTTYRYDAAGRLLDKTYSDGTSPVSYAYDTAGRMIGAATVGGEAAETLEWTYDLLGRMLGETSARNGTIAYTYDDASNRTSVSMDAGLYLTYEYDDASRLRRLLWEGQVFRFEYDASRRKQLEFPNGVTTTYRYDWQGMSRLLEVNAGMVGSPIAYAGYTYDTAGNRTTRVSDAFLEEYGYDRLDRLVEIVTPPSGAARFGYDAVGNRIREESGGAVLTASFEAGNRLASRLAGGSVAVAGSVNETAHVSVNGRNARALEGLRFESEITAAPGTNTFQVRAVDLAGNQTTRSYQLAVGSGGENRHSYDANGNLIRRQEAGHDIRYIWDAENRLIQVLRDNVEIARFGYDPLGRRILKTAGGTTTSYTYDGEDIIRETGAIGAPRIRYVHGPGIDEPLARESVTGREYFHADGLGSIIRVTNQAGTVTLRRQYDAWGNPLEGGNVGGYAFTGREWDPETGLYYYRARYYDPKLGRFISEDPIGFSGGINFYRYAAGNPSRWRDPSGLEQWPENLGMGWRARVDAIPNTSHFEIHVGNAAGKEVGIVSGTQGWIAKHGHAATRPAGMPEAVVNKLNGLNVRQLRLREVIGKQGTQNIRSCRYLAAGRVLGLASSALNILALVEGFEADAARSLRAAEGSRSISEQLVIDAYAEGGNGMLYTVFGAIPVEALVGTGPKFY